jgi:hypothetical protein
MNPGESVDQAVAAALTAMSESGAQGARAFHERFFSLDPEAVTLLTRAQLAAALPGRAAMFSRIGAVGTTLRTVRTDPIDDMHVLARTVWDVRFRDPHATPLALEATYLMRLIEGEWKVLVYINHRNIAATIAERLRDSGNGASEASLS